MKKIIILTSLSFVLASCGQSFEQASKNGSQSKRSHACFENCTNNNNGNNITEAPEIELDGKVNGGIWDGKELLKLDMDSLSLLVRVPVDFEAEIVSGSFPIPGNTDLNLEFVTDDNNAKHLQLRIPLTRLLGDAQLPSEMGLPSGDPLPMVRGGGRLPHVQTALGKTDVHFYLGKGIASLFVPTKFNPFVTLVFPIKNGQKEKIGHFATIAEKGIHRGGFYVSVELPEEIKDSLDTWLPLID